MKKLRIIGAFLAAAIAVAGVPELAIEAPLAITAEAASKLAAPKNLSAEVTNKTAKITWKKVTGASAYRLYLYNASTKKFKKYKDVSGTTCKISGLSAGKTYQFKVVALKKSGGKYVEQTFTEAKKFTTKLSAPKNLKATVSSSTAKVKLTWSKLSGADAYEVFQYDAKTKKFKPIKTITKNYLTIEKISSGTYYFKVAGLVSKNGNYVLQTQSAYIKAKVKAAADSAEKYVQAKEHVSGYRYGNVKKEIKHDLKYMRDLNTDFVGWLTIKDTPISYPVMQASNNEYYLTHTFYGKVDGTKVGTTFVDYHVPITKNSSPDNLILYGHNIKTGDGFAKAVKYSPRYPESNGTINFYKTHPTIKYESVFGGQSTYVVFAGMFVNTDSKHGEVFNYHKFRNFGSKDTFYKYFEQVFDRSEFYNPAVDIKYGDKFLTISTCYYPFGANVDTRYVLFARQLRSGESSKIDTSKAYKNSSPKYFTYFYKATGMSKWAGRKWSKSLIQGYSAWLKTKK